MKSKAIVILTIALVAIIGWSYTTINQYEGKLEVLNDEKVELESEKSYLEAQTNYMVSQSTVGSEEVSLTEFNRWPDYFDAAEQLVKDSDGNFQRSWALYLVKEAEKYEIDPFLVYELLKVETGHTFDPNLVGPETKYGHAYGMAQFMKNTAPWIADMVDLPYEEQLLYDPYYSMKLSLVYLDFLHHEYENWDEALTAYHRGMAGLEQYKLKNGHANSVYAETIQENAEKHQSVAFAN